MWLGLSSEALAIDSNETLPVSACGKIWTRCELVDVTTTFSHIITRQKKPLHVKVRAGYIDAKSGTKFQGNILYFQGLADSMRNHNHLFTRLSQAGYQVIAFDYMGQGGSEGMMDNTRIPGIVEIGNQIWDLYARDTAYYSQKTILGWSTGGLAAYYAAKEGQADRVILIAPGIVPRTVISITEKSLTSDQYPKADDNPHLDPISVHSPLQVVDFALHLLSMAKKSREWKIPDQIPGYVLLSGQEDKYVDAEETQKTLSENAPHFKHHVYAGALHEIDNEILGIREKVYRRIIRFLNKTQR